MAKRESFYTALEIPGVLLLIFLFALPLSFVFSKAFENNAAPLKAVLNDPYTYRLLLFTLEQALLSALISVVIAIPFAAFFSKYKFVGRRAILALSSLSFAMPTILVVLGFVIWYGNNGTLNNLLMRLLNREEPPLKLLYSFSAIIAAHVYLNFPVAFTLLTASWTTIGRREEIVSYTLGKSKARTFLKVTLPKIRPMLLAAFIVIFLLCFSSFSIVLVLGGNPAYYTLEAEIYQRTNIEGNAASSASLSLFVFIIMILLLLITSGGKRAEKSSRLTTELIKARGKYKFAALLIALLILLLLLPPLLAIIHRSLFTKDGVFTLKGWKEIVRAKHGLASSALKAIINSFIIALITSAISTECAETIALSSAKNNSRWSAVLSSLPMATGSVTLGLGFSFVSAYLLSSSLIVSYILVIASHLVIVMPFAVRTILPGAKRIKENVANASYTLKKGRWETLCSVERPLLKSYRRKAFAFGFALSLGELNATLTLSEGRVTTLPVLLYRMINAYNYQGAAALGTILLLEALIVFFIGEIGGDDGNT